MRLKKRLLWKKETEDRRKGPFRKISLFGEAKRKEYIVALKDHTFYQKENTFTTKEEEAHVFSFYKEAKAISRVYHGKVLGR